MSTNDTLRGLLHQVANEWRARQPEHLLMRIDAALAEPASNDTRRANDYDERALALGYPNVILALNELAELKAKALAEPVSGGVVLPERDERGGRLIEYCEGWNDCIERVAALNGGAVAGHSEHKCNICKDLGTIGYGTSCSPMILCPACTCKGGEW